MAKDTKDSKLKQTKNTFKFVGKATRLDKDGAYVQDRAKDGKRKDEIFRKLKFGVKTSDSNEMTVEMYDYEPEKIFMWNSEKRKKDENYKGDWIPYGTWEEQQDELREQGYAVLQTRIGVTHNKEGKIESKGLPSFVASEEIYNNINNNDSIVVEGEIRYQKYKNNKDEIVERKSYMIKKLYKLSKEVDFEAEDFEETTYFEQEMVFVDGDLDKKEGVMYVTGRIIDYSKKFLDTQMKIVFKDEDGNVDKELEKLANGFKKILKFGDVVKVYGDTLNKVIVKEVEGDEEENDSDNLFAEFGGKKKPKHAQSYVSKNYITEMQIMGIEGLTEAVYEEDDFVVDEGLLDEDKKSDALSEFGGKKKKKNPFKIDKDSDEDEDLDDEELPF